MQGLIFDIKRFSVNDGPGIRTTVFLKGCGLTCLWCHNPESMSPEPEEIEIIEPLDGKIIPTKKTIGRYISIDELTKEVKKDLLTMEESHGGVTFSGGEPLFQFKFLVKALEQVKLLGIHTVVDTSGCAFQEQYRQLLPFTDMFLFDIKVMDSFLHQKYTGTDNVNILSNFDFLLTNKKKVWVRIPLVPGFNDSSKQMDELISFLVPRRNFINRIDILPFHRIGFHKYNMLKMNNQVAEINPPGVMEIDKIKTKFESFGLTLHIGG